MTSLKCKSQNAGMSHISLLCATADYELHKSIHFCKRIMFLCLLHPTSNSGADTAKDFHILLWFLVWEDAGDAGVLVSGLHSIMLSVNMLNRHWEVICFRVGITHESGSTLRIYLGNESWFQMVLRLNDTGFPTLTHEAWFFRFSLLLKKTKKQTMLIWCQYVYQ